MAYQALVVPMLISAPSDVPDADLGIVKRTVSQWNHAVGRASGKVVLPMSWSEHAVAEFGERPQSILNEQLVDVADMALALFADRLGTPTGEADSGTLEEIEQLVAAGKHVSVLVSVAARSLSGEAAIAEKHRLEKALTELRSKAIVLPYRDDGELVAHVNNMLSMAAGRVEGSAVSRHPAIEDDGRGVWPSVRRETHPTTDSRGRLKNETKRDLVLTNRTGRPVVDVRFAFDDSAGWRTVADGPISRLGPDQDLRYPLMVHIGSSAQAECVVTWRYEDGEPQTTAATVRL